MNSQSNSKIELASEQVEALNKMKTFADNDEPVLVLQGYAGTGKTFILNEYIKYLDSIGVDFVLCAPTHKAKLVIENATGCEGAVTVHQLLSMAPNIEIFKLDYKELEFQCKGYGSIPDEGIVIIDESSMINDDIYKLLRKQCEIQNAKLLFVGDKAQIQPVGSNSTSTVFECPNTITLTQIHRQVDTNGLLPLLSKLRSKPLRRFENIEAPEGSLNIYSDTKEFMLKSGDTYKKAIKKQDIYATKLIAYTNARVKGLNNCIRKIVWGSNAKNQYNQFEFLTGYENFEYNKTQFYNSMDYIVTSKPIKTDRLIPNFIKLPGYELELYDSVYKELLNVFILDETIESTYLDSLAAKIEDLRISAIESARYRNRTRTKFLWTEYYKIMKSFAISKDLMWDNRVIKKKTFDYGYASTIHKIQGSSLGNIFIDMSNIFLCKNLDELRQMQYVALSRTKSDAYMLV